MFTRNIYSFCSQNEPPKGIILCLVLGFEKFKRQPKSQDQSDQEHNEALSKDQKASEEIKYDKKQKEPEQDKKKDDEIDEKSSKS